MEINLIHLKNRGRKQKRKGKQNSLQKKSVHFAGFPHAEAISNAGKQTRSSRNTFLAFGESAG